MSSDEIDSPAMSTHGDSSAGRGDRISRTHLNVCYSVRSSGIAGHSVATLHWLPDHEHVFEELARVVRPGGRLVLEAGGHGNIAEFLRVLGADYDDGARSWNFAVLREMPGDERAAFVTDVCDRLPAPAIDFVRLQIEATRLLAGSGKPRAPATP